MVNSKKKKTTYETIELRRLRWISHVRPKYNYKSLSETEAGSSSEELENGMAEA